MMRWIEWQWIGYEWWLAKREDYKSQRWGHKQLRSGHWVINQ